jgi:hypothetical protein
MIPELVARLAERFPNLLLFKDSGAETRWRSYTSRAKS